MSYIPIRESKGLRYVNCTRFLGLNRKENTQMGEFSGMENMTSDAYPFLASGKILKNAGNYSKIEVVRNGAIVLEDAENIRAVIAPPEGSEVTKFCGVIGTNFYYDGKVKHLYQSAVYDNLGNYLYGMKIPSDGVIQLLWVNKTIIIHGYNSQEVEPFIYYYNIVHGVNEEDCVRSYEYDHKGDYGENVSVNNQGVATVNFSYETAPFFEGGFYDLKVGDNVFIDGLMKFYDSKWQIKSKNDITSAVVTKYTESVSSTSVTEKIWNVQIKFDILNYKSEMPNINIYSRRVYHIYKKIPPMTHLAIHKGRLWGTSPNGEYVYASALNDVFNFNQYEGLSGDSVFLESSLQGEYLGVISCGDTVVALKKNSIEAIYGDIPNEIAVGKIYTDIGCEDINSCAVINNTLYFLGRRGFYSWNGTYPKLISEPLNKKYISAYGFTDGEKYYASCYDGNSYENPVFDKKYMLWHKTDCQNVNGGFLKDGKPYMVLGGRLKEYDSNETLVDWSVESIKYFFSDYDMESAVELWISINKSDGKIKISTSVDGEAWQLEKEISGTLKNKIIRVPIRLREGMFWQYKIQGKGKAVIYAVQTVYDKGGRNYR